MRRAQLRKEAPHSARPLSFVGYDGTASDGYVQARAVPGLDADWKKDKAQNIFQNALKANAEIDLVYGHNDPMAHGAFQAARAAGRDGEMKFIGIDALPDEGVRWVRAGELTATLLYPTPGVKGIDLALKILNGESIEKRITLGTRVFTKANVDRGGEEVKPDPGG